jgi:hypothetical protein
MGCSCAEFCQLPGQAVKPSDMPVVSCFESGAAASAADLNPATKVAAPSGHELSKQDTADMSRLCGNLL